MPQLAGSLPRPPYYAAVFTSQRACGHDEEYATMAARMSELACDRPGYLGMTSLRNAEGFGVSISYWTDVAAMQAWRLDAEHQIAQKRGRDDLYEWFRVEVCRVERSGEFGAQPQVS